MCCEDTPCSVYVIRLDGKNERKSKRAWNELLCQYFPRLIDNIYTVRCGMSDLSSTFKGGDYYFLAKKIGDYFLL